MKKKINPGIARFYMDLAEPWVKEGVVDIIAKMPEDPDGVEVDTDDIEKIFLESIEYGVKKVEELIGGIPDKPVNPFPKPVEPTKYSYEYHHVFINGDGETPFYNNTRILMQCPGQAAYDSVKVGDVAMKLNPSQDEGRYMWTSKAPGLFDNGKVIVCKKGDKTVRFKMTGKDMFGRCK